MQAVRRAAADRRRRGSAVIRADVVAQAHGLGGRRSAVLAAIHEAGELALAGLEPLFPDVTRRSLQRDLRLLLDKGLIREAPGASGPTDPNRSYRPSESGPEGGGREL